MPEFFYNKNRFYLSIFVFVSRLWDTLGYYGLKCGDFREFSGTVSSVIHPTKLISLRSLSALGSILPYT